MFASPERALLFDLNDFDETLPGPFEYDVKRLAASFTIAGQSNGLTKAEAHNVTLVSVKAYREAMAEFAQMRARMDIWYAHLSEQELMAAINTARGTAKDKEQRKEAREGKKAAKSALKARTRDSQQLRCRSSPRSTWTETIGSCLSRRS